MKRADSSTSVKGLPLRRAGQRKLEHAPSLDFRRCRSKVRWDGESEHHCCADGVQQTIGCGSAGTVGETEHGRMRTARRKWHDSGLGGSRLGVLLEQMIQGCLDEFLHGRSRFVQG